MLTIRSFFAVDFCPDVLSELSKIIHQTKSMLPDGHVRFTPVENLHLTLKFLGDVDPGKLKSLTPAILQLTSQTPAFSFEITGQGVFPNPARASVLWIGCADYSNLAFLAKGLDQIVQTIGIQPELRAFKPHLTIARVNSYVKPTDLPKISAAFLSQKIGHIGSSKVETITLYKSDLNPGGAKYTILEQYPLAPA